MIIEPEPALQQIINLLKRTPMSELEGIGAQNCIDSIVSAQKELKDLKATPAVKSGGE